jgi:hypothetical protein
MDSLHLGQTDDMSLALTDSNCTRLAIRIRERSILIFGISVF